MDKTEEKPKNNGSITKLFFCISAKKELKKLNELGEKGLLLTDVSALDRKFIQTDTKYEYFIDFTDFSPDSDRGAEIVGENEKQGKKLCAFARGWAYYAVPLSDERPDEDFAACERVKAHYRSVSIFCFIMFLFFTGLCAYNFYMRASFISSGYVNPAGKMDFEWANVIYNALLEGKNPASVFLCFIIPADAVFLWLTACFSGEYFAWKKGNKALKEQMTFEESKLDFEEKSEESAIGENRDTEKGQNGNEIQG